MKYKVIYSVTTDFLEAIGNFENEINKTIIDGWTPQGGIVFDKNNYMHQAMIKED